MLSRSWPARATRRARGSGRHTTRTLGTLLSLAVVATAGAPSLITVRSGDTLWDLAREHGTSVTVLQRLNELPGNAMIYIGDTLRLPGGPATTRPASGSGGSGAERRHLVVSGDTLGGLALRYGVDTAAIATRNQLTGNVIQRGRTLTIPGAAVTRAKDIPTTNAGVRIPEDVRQSAAQHRATLAARKQPSKAQARKLVAATARRYGVSPSLAGAVAYHESGFQQGVVSSVDAIGVMQVLPSTGRALGRQQGRTFDLLTAQDNITAGVLLLRQLIRSTGSADEALAGYYQGLGSISRRGVLPQTHSYIRNITVLRERFPRG